MRNTLKALTFIIFITNLISSLLANSAIVFRVNDPDNIRGFCTGVKIAQKTYLTAAHCVREVNSKYGQFQEGKNYIASNEKQNYSIFIDKIILSENTLNQIACLDHAAGIVNCPFYDIAILHTKENNDIKVSPIDRNIELSIGMDIDIYSSYLFAGVALIHEKSQGYINSIKSSTYIFSDRNGTLNSGDSGSPIYTTINNKSFLIGIISFMRNYKQGGFISILDRESDFIFSNLKH